MVKTKTLAFAIITASLFVLTSKSLETRTFQSTDIQNSTRSTFYDSIRIYKNSSQVLHSKNKVGDPTLRDNSGIRVVSYSLFSNSQSTSMDNPRYTDGLIANIDLMPLVYPSWQMWIYHDGNLPKNNFSIQRALQKPFVRLIDMSQSGIRNKMSWRFLVASDLSVERFVVRDIDSRLSFREVDAVNEWIESGRAFHVIRDHPSHSNFALSGGLWGGTTEAVPEMKDKLLASNSGNDYLEDMTFLNREIWSLAQTRGVMQHDSFSCEKYKEPEHSCRCFPTARYREEHVGSVYIGGKIREGDATILSDAINRGKECERNKGRKWWEEFNYITDKGILTEACDVMFRTRSGTNLVMPLEPNTVVCVKGDKKDLIEFFRLNITVPFTLVTIESDESVPQEVEWASNPAAWYGWNSKDPKLVHPLPIGLNEESMLEAIQKAERPSKKKYKGKVLFNFKLDRPWRKTLWEMSASWPFAERIPYMGSTWKEAGGQIAWYNTFAQYEYVACPEGLGIDTHRLWEALYLGVRPIVLRNEISDLFVGLPMIIVLDKWEDLTEEVISSSAGDWSLTYASLTAWKNLISRHSKESL